MNATQPAMAFPGLLATIHPTEGYKESNDDFDIGVQKLTRKASIENLGLDALLDVEAETVNLILGLDEPFQHIKKDFEVFQKSIEAILPPISWKEMTWKTYHIAHIVVGGELDDLNDYEIWSSPTHTPSSLDMEIGELDTVSPESNGYGTMDDPIVPVPAKLPMLTTFEDEQGTMERPVIFSNEFFEIRRSPTAGWGAFAIRKLHMGDQILVEKALYHAIHEDVTQTVRQLPEKERLIANDLHAHFSREGETWEEAVWSTNAFSSRRPVKFGKDSAAEGGPDFFKDVAGIFPVAGRFNHSCSPRIDYKYRAQNEALILTVRDWKIEEGEELTISYGKDPSVLFYKFGFICNCGHCRGFDPKKSEYY